MVQLYICGLPNEALFRGRPVVITSLNQGLAHIHAFSDLGDNITPVLPTH